MVPRARIELATPAFSGPRSTSELPRHRYSIQFYGNCAALTNENEKSLDGGLRGRGDDTRGPKRARPALLHRIVVFLHPPARFQYFAGL
jgi:hypothetical protein